MRARQRLGLIVEFTGVTGVGKTTLVAAVQELLAQQGFVVREAHEAILRSYGLNLPGRPKVQSFLVHLFSVLPFLRYALSREGFQLSRLAVRLIVRDAGSPRIAVMLLRNFVKRIAVHLLLRQRCRPLGECDFFLCDEGTVHTAHNLFVHAGPAPRADEIIHFADLIPKPDLAVWVTAPESDAVQCTLRRGHARINNNPGEIEAFVAHGSFTFNTLCSVRSITNRLFVIENSTRDPGGGTAAIQERAYAIGGFLTQHYRASMLAKDSTGATGEILEDRK